jgi:hypothetical protein
MTTNRQQLLRLANALILIAGMMSCSRQPATEQHRRSPEAAEAFTIQELLTELRLREATEATKKMQFDPSQAFGSIAGTIRSASPKRIPQKTNPRLAGISSQEIYDRLIDLQAHWGGSAGRQEWFAADPALQQDARKVVSLFPATQFSTIQTANGLTYRLNFQTLGSYQYMVLGTTFPLCDNEPFREQPIGAFCSGVLVARNVIATAAHCLAVEPDPTKIRFVFDYRMTDAQNAQTSFGDDQIYLGKNIIDQRPSRIVEDWALIALDRDVKDTSRVATVRREGTLNTNEAVFAIGHPTGLPVKISAGGVIRDNSHQTIFTAALDVYSASSGCPIFNQQHVVEGILSRGDVDFVLEGRCARTHNCPDVGCTGDDCTRTTAFAHAIRP